MNRLVGVNGLVLAVLLSFLLPLHAQNNANLTDRDYFNEIIASGGLDGISRGHVCFQAESQLCSRAS